ncbi:hypothetical protein ABZ858_05265 [Streptomyces sp. NPDC047017]|uniref:hypothetical protein n=1 Tax=Streptomyces sp. NPDC047017 TaxID=3155024 RepID=UPI0033DDB6D1
MNGEAANATPRWPVRPAYGSSSCLREHPVQGLRCTEPAEHDGPHWHAYTRTEWQ